MKKMKKILTYILVLALALSMVACHKTPAEDHTSDTQSTVEEKYVNRIDEAEIEVVTPDLTLKSRKQAPTNGLREFLMELFGLGQDSEATQEQPEHEYVEIDVSKDAPSMYAQVQAIVVVFRKDPDLQYSQWKELSAEERLDNLQELEGEVAQIARRDEVPVLMDDLGDYTYGQYDPSTNSITIHEDLIESDSWDAYIETMDTIFHEGRHAYQFYNLYEEEVEPNAQMVDAWRVNIDVLGYESGDGAYGYEKYYTQPIEVDARVFAEEVLVTLDLR